MSTGSPPDSASPLPAATRRTRGLRGDILTMAAAKIGVLLFGAVTTVVLARSLGPSGRGTLASVYALTALLAQLGTLGIASANPYFAAREPHIRGRIAGNSLWLAGVLGAGMVLLGIAIRLVAPSALAGITWPELAVGLGAVPIMLGSLFLQSVLLADGRTALYNGVEVGAALVTVALVGSLLPLTGGGVLLALCLLVAPQLGAFVVYASAMRRYGRLLRRLDGALARRMVGYGARAFLVTLLSYLLLRIDLLLVNGIQGARAAGQYSIGVTIADALFLLPISVSMNLFARVARGVADQELVLSAFQLVALAYFGICVVVALVADPAITIFFGPQYHPAISLFLLLLPGVYCLGVLNVIAYYFAGRGMPWELVMVWIPGLAVNLGLDAALLPDHGTYVASLASTIAYALVLALHLRMFARDLGGWSRLRPTVAGTTSALRIALRRD